MTLDELITWCELRGDKVEISDCIRTMSNPVIACEYKTVALTTKSFSHNAFIEYREWFGRKAVEKCSVYINTSHRGRLRYDDISLEKLVKLYLES